MNYVPRPGDIVLVPIGGMLGRVIALLQGVVALDWSRYTHAAIVLEDGLCVAAQPGGARIDRLDEVIGDGPAAVLPLPDWADRAAVVAYAWRLVDRPYSYLSYLWIGLTSPRGFVHLRSEWLLKRVASDRAMMCSAAADRAWMAGGVQMFNDGRPIGSVSPGDLTYVGTLHHLDAGPWPSAPLA